MENFYWKVSAFSNPTKCRFEAELMDHLMIGSLRPEKTALFIYCRTFNIESITIQSFQCYFRELLYREKAVNESIFD